MEWNTTVGKKSSKAQARESKSAFVKADHLRLWGSGAPLDPALSVEPSPSSASAQSNDKSERKKKRGKRKKKQASSVEIPEKATPADTVNNESNISASFDTVSNKEGKKNDSPEQPQELESPKSATSLKPTFEAVKKKKINGSSKVMGTLPKVSVLTPPAPAPKVVDTPSHRAIGGSDTIVEMEPAPKGMEQFGKVSATVNMATKEGTKVVHSTGCDEASMDTISPDLTAQWDLVDSFEAVAVRCAKEIRAAIIQLPGIDSPGGENRYLALQVAIIRANQTIYHLQKATLRTGAEISSSDSPLDALRSALELADLYKVDMEKALPQKNTTFKNTFYSILKTGKASVWLAAVSNEELVTDMQADGNRLYQLLMEGKKLNHLELVDAGTLFAASGRKDIFSSKHIQALRKRLTKVELRTEEDARAYLIQTEKEAAAEKLRQSLEARASFANLGDNVRICGLSGRPDLNGKVATYAGLGEGDLYVIRLYEGEFISLPQENFVKWNGLAPATYVSKQSIWKPTIWDQQDIRLIEHTERKNLEIEQTLPSSPAAKPVAAKSRFKVRVVSPVKFSQRHSKQFCKFGKDCHFLKSGKCKYVHTFEEYACMTGPRAYRDKAEESRRPPVTADKSDEILQVFWLHKKKAAYVSGHHRRNLKEIGCLTGAHLYGDPRRAEKDGLFRINVRGPSQTVVDQAIAALQGKEDEYDEAATARKKIVTELNDPEMLESKADQEAIALVEENFPSLNGHSSQKTTVDADLLVGATAEDNCVVSETKEATPAEDNFIAIEDEEATNTEGNCDEIEEEKVPPVENFCVANDGEKPTLAEYKRVSNEGEEVALSNKNHSQETVDTEPKVEKVTPSNETVSQEMVDTEAKVDVESKEIITAEDTCIPNDDGEVAPSKNHITQENVTSDPKEGDEANSHVERIALSPNDGGYSPQKSIVSNDEMTSAAVYPSTPSSGSPQSYDGSFSPQKTFVVDNEPIPVKGYPTTPSSDGLQKFDAENEEASLRETSPTTTLSAAAIYQDNLLTFLQSHKSALKCSPNAFLAWLHSEDITTIYDLEEAVQDELAVSALLQHGLKKFKLATFSKDISDEIEACTTAN